MRFDISIKEKLIIYFVTLGIISLASAGIYTFFSTRNALINRSFEQLTSVREVKKQRLETFFFDRKHELELLAQNYCLQKTISKNESKKTTSIESLLENENHIVDFLVNSGYYSHIFIFSEDSNLKSAMTFQDSLNKFRINKQEEFSLNEIAKKTVLKNKALLHDYILLDSVPTLIISISTNHKNSINEIIALGIPYTAINRIMLEQHSHNGLGESGESYLVGSDLLMRSTSRFKKNSILKIKVETLAVQNAINRQKGTEVINDYRGINVLSSYRKLEIEGLDWIILAEIDFKEITAPVYNLRNDIILISALISILLLIFASIIAIRISKPLIKLSNFAIEISKGNYGKTLPILSKDEIGMLTESFNLMSVQIKEQTKALGENEKRLHHFYNATRDGIVLHDRGRPILVNQAICELTQFNEKELQNKKITEIFAVNDIDSYTKHPDKRFTYETICYRKSGINIPVEIQENPIEYEGNIISSSVIRDISERAIAERILNNERKKRMTSFIDGQEDERKRLSRELHDGLAQSLIAIKMRLESMDSQNTEEILQTTNIIKQHINNTIEDVRQMSNNLMPSVLREFGLVEAIQQLCKQTIGSTGINISFNHQKSNIILDDRIKTYLYRIVQEGLNNAIKHSKAEEILIMLKYEEKQIRLIIEDNGVGFDMEKNKSTGNGLYNMKERATLLRGNVAIFSAPGSGTIINAKLPISDKID